LGFAYNPIIAVSFYILQSVPKLYFVYYSCVFFFLSSFFHPSPTPSSCNHSHPTYSSLYHTACQQHSQLTRTPSATFLLFAPQRAFRFRIPSVLAFLLLSGDIELNPGPVTFTVCTLNIRSILHPLHSAALSGLIDCYNPDLFCLTETWIKPTTTSAELETSKLYPLQTTPSQASLVNTLAITLPLAVAPASSSVKPLRSYPPAFQISLLSNHLPSLSNFLVPKYPCITSTVLPRHLQFPNLTLFFSTTSIHSSLSLQPHLTNSSLLATLTYILIILLITSPLSF